jgi:predicted permease
MVNSLVRARTVDLGYEPSRAVAIAIFPPLARYPSVEQRYELQMALLDRVRRLPGVAAAGAIDYLQLGGSAPPRGLGAGTPRGGGLWSVTPGYFAAMQTPVLEGREFTESEGRDLPIAIVNEAAAAFFWPGERSIVGRVLRLEEHQPRQVVGVVKNARYGYGRGSAASVYLPAGVEGHRMLTIVARASGDPSALAAMMRTEGQRLDPKLVIRVPDTVDNLLHSGLARSRFQTTLFAMFAGLGLVLTAVGIYGVIAYWVSGRTREMGIRVALGAEPHAVKRLVIRQALMPVVGGMAAGLAGAFVLTRQLRSLLYEITPHDPLTLMLAALILGGVALAAAYVPARRAARVDPILALRSE